MNDGIKDGLFRWASARQRVSFGVGPGREPSDLFFTWRPANVQDAEADGLMLLLGRWSRFLWCHWRPFARLEPLDALLHLFENFQLLPAVLHGVRSYGRPGSGSWKFRLWFFYRTKVSSPTVDIDLFRPRTRRRLAGVKLLSNVVLDGWYPHRAAADLGGHVVVGRIGLRIFGGGRVPGDGRPSAEEDDLVVNFAARRAPHVAGAVLWAFHFHFDPAPLSPRHVEHPDIVEDAVGPTTSADNEQMIFIQRHLRLSVAPCRFRVLNVRLGPRIVLQVVDHHIPVERKRKFSIWAFKMIKTGPFLLRGLSEWDLFADAPKDDHLLAVNGGRMPSSRGRRWMGVLKIPSVCIEPVDVEFVKKLAHLVQRGSRGLRPAAVQHQRVLVTDHCGAGLWRRIGTSRQWSDPSSCGQVQLPEVVECCIGWSAPSKDVHVVFCIQKEQMKLKAWTVCISMWYFTIIASSMWVSSWDGGKQVICIGQSFPLDVIWGKAWPKPHLLLPDDLCNRNWH